MQDVSLPRRLPSEKQFKQRIFLGRVLFYAGGVLLLASFVRNAVMSTQGTPFSPLWQMMMAASALIIAGVVLLLFSAGRRDKYYGTVSDGVIVKVAADANNHTFIVVRGPNLVGRETDETVYLHPDGWRKLNEGDRYTK